MVAVLSHGAVCSGMLGSVFQAGYRAVAVAQAVVQKAYLPDSSLTPEEFGFEDVHPHDFIICQDGDRDRPLRFEPESNTLLPVPTDFMRTAGVSPRNLEQRMALDLLIDPEVQLISLVGKAGTGKMFLALATAMAQLAFGDGSGEYERIVLSKPVIPMGADIGSLPGDFEAKMQPWMMSFFDNLDQLMPDAGDAVVAKGATQAEKAREHLFQTGQLKVQALHTIRGRSVSRAVMVTTRRRASRRTRSRP